MASSKLKGIVIEIGGDTQKLDKALESSRKASAQLQAELKGVDRMLKLDPSNIELLTQKQDILTGAIDATTKKLEILKNSEEQLAQQLQSGQIGEDQYRAFQRELIKTENDLASMQSRLADVQGTLAGTSGEVTDTRNGLERLTDTIDEQTKQLEDLRDEYTRVVLEQGENSVEAKKLAGNMAALNDDLQESQQQLKKAQDAADKLAPALKDAGDSADEAGGGFTIMKGALADITANAIQSAVSGVGNLVSGLLELTEATEEYRTMQNKLQGSAASFGYSMEYVKDQYAELYRYVGDDQMATNAITNLLGMKVSTETLNDVVDGAIGVWSAYGDSIPIESLTESITESVNVSKVTGTLADTINWAKLSNEQWNKVLGQGSEAQKAFNKTLKDGEAVEDAFSAALAATTDQQDRAQMVADLLNETYGESKKTYDELSGALLDTRDAQLELKETQAELGEILGPVNNKFTEFKNDALEAITPLIEDLANGFMDLIEWLEDTPGAMEAVTAVVAGLATAFGVLATALAIQGLITGVTKALALLSATIAANPIMLLVTGLTAAGVALATWASQTNEADKAAKQLNDTIQENTESWNELKKAQSDALSSSLSEIDYVRNLKTELDTLIDANGKIKEGYENRANFIVGELASATGQEISVVDGVIQKYDELSESIDLLIEKKRAQIILDSQEEGYREAITKRTEALTTLNQLEQDIADARAERAAAQEEYDNAVTLTEQSNAAARLATASMEYNEKSQTYEDQKALVQEYNDAIAQYEYDAKLIASGNADDLAEINNRIAQSYTDKGEQVRLSLEQQIANETELLEYYKELYRQTNDEMYLDQANAAQARLDQLNADLEAQTSTIQNKTPEITGKWSELTNQSIQAFTRRMNEYGTNAQKMVDNATSGVNAKKPNLLNKWKEVSDQSFQNYLAHQPEYNPKGQDAVQGVIDGVNAKQGSLFSKMWNLGKSMLSNLAAALDSHSPSKEMAKQGDYAVEGVEQGIEQNKEKALDATYQMGQEMIDAYQGAQLDRALADSTNLTSLSNTVGSGNTVLAERIDALYNLISEYLPTIADNSETEIRLDGNTLVGELLPRIDAGLGDLSITKQRGG